MAFGQVIELLSSKCPKKRPKAVKTCNLKPCRNPMIELRKVVHRSKNNKESNSIDERLFIQKESNKRISLKVNGEAIVISGTIVRLRCPRHKNAKEEIQTTWLKNRLRIVFTKRVKMTSKNVLRIKGVETSDSGFYSCSWDNKTFHTINLHIKQLERTDDDRTVEQQNFNSKIGLNNYNYGKVVVDSEDATEDDQSHDISELLSGRQRLMKVKPKRANHHSIKASPLNDQSFSGESPANDEEKATDTFEVIYGPNSKEMSDQNIAKEVSINNREDDNSEEKFRGERRRGNSVSLLHKILTDLKKQSQSESESEANISGNSGFVANPVKNNSNETLTESKFQRNYENLMNRLGSESREATNWNFDWMTTEWSTCSAKCGVTGFQVSSNWMRSCAHILVNNECLIDV